MAIPQKIYSKLLKIDDFENQVFALTFDVPQRYTRFKPGQFLHLTLEKFDPSTGYWPESRVFSICSSPKSDVIKIVYSVKGKYTKRMSDELAEGSFYWLKLPYGDFVLESYNEKDQDVVLIAGGTGLSPFIPYLIDRENSGSTRKINLFYGVREESLMPFEAELRLAREIYRNLSVEIRIEREGDGQLDISSILKQSSALDVPIFFISGPPKMTDSFRSYLIKNGVSERNVRIDSWE